MMSTDGRHADESRLPLRLASGIVLAVFALAASWAGGLVFIAICAVTALGLALEFARLIGIAGRSPSLLAGLLLLGLAFIVLASGKAGLALALVLLAAGVATVLGRGTGRASWLLFGLLYAGLPALGLAWLRATRPESLGDVLLLFVIVIASDTGAYAAGRIIRGPALLPRLSPNKTWAGLIGGLVAGTGAGLGFAAHWEGPISATLVAASPAIALAALLGDIAESALKRHFGHKNSGDLIPGHGGLLDRLDSLIAASALGSVLVLVQEGGGMG